MQILHYLPTQHQLGLNPAVAQSVVDLLIEPFGSHEKALAFWVDYPSTIVVLDQHDDAPQSLASLDDITHHFIEQAESMPEFIESLPDNYHLLLTITGDSGEGFYLIKPVNMCLNKGSADD
jgi:hypothetical protein